MLVIKRRRGAARAFRRLVHCVRADDYGGRQFPNPAEGQTVARSGGERSTILLPSISLLIEAATVAERVVKAVDPISSRQYRVTCRGQDRHHH